MRKIIAILAILGGVSCTETLDIDIKYEPVDRDQAIF
ncbi:MAG: hypothetical protein ACI8TA_001156 [Cyclobacteriaceae bacterium]|jgi:hypothetical protein